MKHRILACSLILVLTCIVTMSHAGLTAFLPDIMNGHYSMFTAVSNGHFIQNGHY